MPFWWIQGIVPHNNIEYIETCCYIDRYKKRENVYLLLGRYVEPLFQWFATNPVEILYNELADNGINVFHAMPCQKKFYHLFERGEKQ
jgi:hypothetical protein